MWYSQISHLIREGGKHLPIFPHPCSISRKSSRMLTKHASLLQKTSLLN